MATTQDRTAERICPKDALRSKEAYVEYLRHLFAYTVAASSVTPQQSALEIGCGQGYGTAYLAGYVRQIIGLDIDAAVVANANRFYGSPECRFELYDGTTIPYEDGTFHLAASFQVIEHLREPLQLLREMRRILKPDGVVILTTPNAARRLDPGQRPWNRFHICEYRPEQLRQLLQTVFPTVRINGIQGSPEIQALERARIQRIRRLAAFDPLRLRRLLPAAWEARLAARVQHCLKRPKRVQEIHTDLRMRYRVDDFCVRQDDVEKCLDLLAMCRA